MKKPHLNILVTITAVFTAFVLGFFLGRNYNHTDIQLSVASQVPETQPVETVAAQLAMRSSEETELPVVTEPTAPPESTTPLTQEETQSQTEPVPPQTESNPPQTETDPPQTETDPPQTETDPPQTETDPPQTEANPPQTETDPPQTETDPPQTETDPPQTETDPPQTETDPPQTETDPPQTEAPQIETEPPTEPDTSISSGLININTATRAQLESLPGIGEVLAQRIIDYREAYGPFTSVAQLTNVSGIGEKRLAAIIDLVTVG